MRLVEERTLSPQEKAQGIIFDRQVRLGRRGQGRGPWRVVCFQRPGMQEAITVVCSQESADLKAAEVMELYRHRWQVEMFFRWLKCLVPCRHWLAESRQGVNIQIYLALIEALLLAELTGRRPNRRSMELLRWHAMGWASDAELAAGLKTQWLRQSSAKNSKKPA